MSDSLRFVAVAQTDPLAEPLLAELAVEYAQRYGGSEAGVSAWLRGHPAADFAAPHGALLIGLLGGRPVTGGAFQRFDDETAELKRIWTASGYRRHHRNSRSTCPCRRAWIGSPSWNRRRSSPSARAVW